MNVIVDMTLASQEFELGRILSMEGETSIVLETMVPLEEHAVPFFRVQGERRPFEERVRDHAAVNEISVVNTHNDETLYALDWDISTDTFFEGIAAQNANILNARGLGEIWEFELRFPTHATLSTFQEHCLENDIPIEVMGLYNPTRPDAGPWYGLTPPQRQAISRAVESGYYSIPRRISTNDLAAEFDISDQAMTERLRRAINNLVSNTLLITPEEPTSPR